MIGCEASTSPPPDCGLSTRNRALPLASLLESTLFGHVKGAFTSAIQTKKGYFEVADHGIIFFDEIGTVAPDMEVPIRIPTSTVRVGTPTLRATCKPACIEGIIHLMRTSSRR